MKDKYRPDRPINDERGAVTVFTAIAMIVFIGFVGLTVDFGYRYYQREKIQNAVDAAALAAARELPVKAGYTQNYKVENPKEWSDIIVKLSEYLNDNNIKNIVYADPDTGIIKDFENPFNTESGAVISAALHTDPASSDYYTSVSLSVEVPASHFFIYSFEGKMASIRCKAKATVPLPARANDIIPFALDSGVDEENRQTLREAVQYPWIGIVGFDEESDDIEKLCEYIRNQYFATINRGDVVINKKTGMTQEVAKAVSDRIKGHEKCKEGSCAVFLNDDSKCPRYATLIKGTDIFEDRVRVSDLVRVWICEPETVLEDMKLTIEILKTENTDKIKLTN